MPSTRPLLYNRSADLLPAPPASGDSVGVLAVASGPLDFAFKRDGSSDGPCASSVPPNFRRCVFVQIASLPVLQPGFFPFCQRCFSPALFFGGSRVTLSFRKVAATPNASGQRGIWDLNYSLALTSSTRVFAIALWLAHAHVNRLRKQCPVPLALWRLLFSPLLQLMSRRPSLPHPVPRSSYTLGAPIHHRYIVFAIVKWHLSLLLLGASLARQLRLSRPFSAGSVLVHWVPFDILYLVT